MNNITPREQAAILKSLAAGLVPQIGLHHLVVGRKRELQALSGDVDAVKQGGSAFRLLTGPNGVGKTFLVTLLRGIAIESRVVVLSADLGINHRLVGSDGRGRALISSLMTGICTKASPTGNGLRAILESWIAALGFDLGDQNSTPEAMTQRIFNALRPLKDYPSGFEFAQVIAKYYEGHFSDNPVLQDAALRWLRVSTTLARCCSWSLWVKTSYSCYCTTFAASTRSGTNPCIACRMRRSSVSWGGRSRGSGARHWRILATCSAPS
ncbi:MAG: DUF2791 family P-loop domain-containing protein [Verrucomicrobia bacterium]|nr:DUF2791 family P-loop domain-containing protein [Verrucomicrobiota bacterium]